MIRPPSTLVFAWTDSARALYADAYVDSPALSVGAPSTSPWAPPRFFRVTKDGSMWLPLTREDCEPRTLASCTVAEISDHCVRYAWLRALTTHARAEHVRQGEN